jgi:RimJ/RimL family protein N-acetyltransferase
METDSGALTFRSAEDSDWNVLLDFATSEPVTWIGSKRLQAEHGTNNYRNHWSWIAEREGRPVGRALWWGQSEAATPASLDCVIVNEDEPDLSVVACGLIHAGLSVFGTSPEFNVDLHPDWRSNTRAVEAAAWREEAAHRAGLTRTTERISFAWTAGSRMPSDRGILVFRDGTDEEFRALFGAVAADSLDTRSANMLVQHGKEALADDDLDFYRSLPGRRSDWKIAELPSGDTVGFIIPTRTAYDASISYLGILPEHRGQGFVNDLLATMVRMHDADGAERIVGTTDAVNSPMRAAFERAHFKVTRTRMVHTS